MTNYSVSFTIFICCCCHLMNVLFFQNVLSAVTFFMLTFLLNREDWLKRKGGVNQDVFTQVRYIVQEQGIQTKAKTFNDVQTDTECKKLQIQTEVKENSKPLQVLGLKYVKCNTTPVQTEQRFIKSFFDEIQTEPSDFKISAFFQTEPELLKLISTQTIIKCNDGGSEPLLIPELKDVKCNSTPVQTEQRFIKSFFDEIQTEPSDFKTSAFVQTEPVILKWMSTQTIIDEGSKPVIVSELKGVKCNSTSVQTDPRYIKSFLNEVKTELRDFKISAFVQTEPVVLKWVSTQTIIECNDGGDENVKSLTNPKKVLKISLNQQLYVSVKLKIFKMRLENRWFLYRLLLETMLILLFPLIL